MYTQTHAYTSNISSTVNHVYTDTQIHKGQTGRIKVRFQKHICTAFVWSSFLALNLQAHQLWEDPMLQRHSHRYLSLRTVWGTQSFFFIIPCNPLSLLFVANLDKQMVCWLDLFWLNSYYKYKTCMFLRVWHAQLEAVNFFISFVFISVEKKNSNN